MIRGILKSNGDEVRTAIDQRPNAIRRWSVKRSVRNLIGDAAPFRCDLRQWPGGAKGYANPFAAHMGKGWRNIGRKAFLRPRWQGKRRNAAAVGEIEAGQHGTTQRTHREASFIPAQGPFWPDPVHLRELRH